MALDQNATPAAAGTIPGPAIENEIPAYRAISPHAVVGLIAGVLAVTSFADLYFLSFAAVAILLGIYADRRIRRHPDALTGLGLARAAIALGLVFGLASVTTASVQSVIRKVHATRFANKMVGVLQDGTLADAVWYTVQPEARDGKTSEELYQAIAKEFRGPAETNPQVEGFMAIKKRLKSTPGQKIHFVKFEGIEIEKLDIVAYVLIDVDGPPSPEFPDAEQFALLVVRGRTLKGRMRWTVSSVVFPYKPATYVAAPQPVDDGHGHAH